MVSRSTIQKGLGLVALVSAFATCVNSEKFVRKFISQQNRTKTRVTQEYFLPEKARILEEGTEEEKNTQEFGSQEYMQEFEEVDIMLTNGHLEGVITLNIELSDDMSVYLGNGAVYGPFDEHVDHIYVTKDGLEYSFVRNRDFENHASLFNTMDETMGYLLDNSEGFETTYIIEGFMPNGNEYIFTQSHGECDIKELEVLEQGSFASTTYIDGQDTCSVDGLVDRVIVKTENGEKFIEEHPNSENIDMFVQGSRYFRDLRDEYNSSLNNLLHQLRGRKNDAPPAPSYNVLNGFQSDIINPTN